MIGLDTIQILSDKDMTYEDNIRPPVPVHDILEIEDPNSHDAKDEYRIVNDQEQQIDTVFQNSDDHYKSDEDKYGEDTCDECKEDNYKNDSNDFKISVTEKKNELDNQQECTFDKTDYSNTDNHENCIGKDRAELKINGCEINDDVAKIMDITNEPDIDEQLINNKCAIDADDRKVRENQEYIYVTPKNSRIVKQILNVILKIYLLMLLASYDTYAKKRKNLTSAIPWGDKLIESLIQGAANVSCR